MLFRIWHNESFHYFTIEELMTENLQCMEFDPKQQFTGLKDKNGVEIYEGDIVKIGMTYQMFTEQETRAVEFKDGGFYPFSSWAYEKGIQPEIIGNIYENPELLND